MANLPLTGNGISSSYQGLIKTSDNTALSATEKPLTDGLANALPMTAGTTSVSFTGGVDFTSATVTGLPASTDTTYDLASAQNASDVDVTLTGSDATVDTIKLAAGTNITLTDNGSNQITIDAAGGGAAGLVNGTGANSMQSAASLTTAPANASGDSSIALGLNAVSSGNSSIAIGIDANAAGGNCSISIGKASCAGNYTMAIGVSARTSNVGDTAVGYESCATAGQATTVGRRAKTAFACGTAIGSDSWACAVGATAIGQGITASKANTVSMKELELQTVGGGIYLKSPNGTEYKLTVSDAGALVVA